MTTKTMHDFILFQNQHTHRFTLIDVDDESEIVPFSRSTDWIYLGTLKLTWNQFKCLSNDKSLRQSDNI